MELNRSTQEPPVTGGTPSLDAAQELLTIAAAGAIARLTHATYVERPTAAELQQLGDALGVRSELVDALARFEALSAPNVVDLDAARARRRARRVR